jgi:hypothetical protein
MATVVLVATNAHAAASSKVRSQWLVEWEQGGSSDGKGGLVVFTKTKGLSYKLFNTGQEAFMSMCPKSSLLHRTIDSNFMEEGIWS